MTKNKNASVYIATLFTITILIILSIAIITMATDNITLCHVNNNTIQSLFLSQSGVELFKIKLEKWFIDIINEDIEKSKDQIIDTYLHNNVFNDKYSEDEIKLKVNRELKSEYNKHFILLAEKIFNGKNVHNNKNALSNIDKNDILDSFDTEDIDIEVILNFYAGELSYIKSDSGEYAYVKIKSKGQYRGYISYIQALFKITPPDLTFDMDISYNSKNKTYKVENIRLKLLSMEKIKIILMKELAV